MSRFHSCLILLALAVTAFAIYRLGHALDCSRYAGDIKQEMMYFPSGRSLRVATIGYDTVASDLLWLKGIQYYGEHHGTDKDYPLAEHIFSTITDLDPHFLGAYRFGAYVLAQDVGQPALGVELLRKGIRRNPDDWHLPFDLGFLYFVLLKDNATAAHYFRFASRLEDAPDIAKRFTAFAYRKAGRTGVARVLWEEIYRSSSNKIMRESADYAIKNIDLEQVTARLADLVTRFTSVGGRSPSRLGELVAAGMIKRIPPDPFGGKYFLDPRTAVVVSTTKATRQAEQAKRSLGRSIDRYREIMGEYPSSLSDLEAEGMIDRTPVVAGAEIVYDPAGPTVSYRLTGEGSE